MFKKLAPLCAAAALLLSSAGCDQAEVSESLPTANAVQCYHYSNNMIVFNSQTCLNNFITTASTWTTDDLDTWAAQYPSYVSFRSASAAAEANGLPPIENGLEIPDYLSATIFNEKAKLGIGTDVLKATVGVATLYNSSGTVVQSENSNPAGSPNSDLADYEYTPYGPYISGSTSIRRYRMVSKLWLTNYIFWVRGGAYTENYIWTGSASSGRYVKDNANTISLSCVNGLNNSTQSATQNNKSYVERNLITATQMPPFDQTCTHNSRDGNVYNAPAATTSIFYLP